MTPSNPALELFRRLRDGGDAELQAQLDRPDAENDYIDFKESDSRPNGLPRAVGESDKAHLAECVSGFHNTAGGVVVWGIRCREADPVPRACGPGLENAAGLQTALQQLTSTSVRPGVTGIEWAVASLASGCEALLMYVPPRNGTLPVEANIKQKRGYYFRAGSSFLTIPPDILSSMMGVRPPSRVVPIVTPTKDVGSLALNVHVENQGRGMAFHVYLIVDWFEDNQPGFKLTLGNNQMKLHDLGEHGRYVIGVPDMRLPPSARVVVGTLRIPLEPRRIRIRLQAGAEHDLPTAIDHDLPEEAVRSICDNPGKRQCADIWERLLTWPAPTIPETPL